MTDERDAAISIQNAARIADEILKKADDGTKLFTIHKRYPRRGQAVSFGFYFGCGIAFAVSFCIAIGKVVSLAIGAFA
jgi:hypothetical protein